VQSPKIAETYPGAILLGPSIIAVDSACLQLHPQGGLGDRAIRFAAYSSCGISPSIYVTPGTKPG
jgi:hypothetical protein